MSNDKPINCPICKLESDDITVSDYGERLEVVCERCGKFTITRTASKMAKSMQIGPKFSAWIRELTEMHMSAPDIDSRSLKEISRTFPDYRVSEKQLKLMRALERRTTFPGQAISINPKFDYPLAWAFGEKELQYLLVNLVERKLIRPYSSNVNINSDLVFELQITADGWDYLDQHEKPSVLTDQAFVAMSFSGELDSAWKVGIEPAILKANYKPYRVDMEPHIEQIDTKIISEIKNSRFLIADFTEQRPGVYFEAGFALGIGIPVFWCVQADDLKNVHFDTRQYNHIVWEDEYDLSDKLYYYISAVVGIG